MFIELNDLSHCFYFSKGYLRECNLFNKEKLREEMRKAMPEVPNFIIYASSQELAEYWNKADTESMAMANTQHGYY